MISRFIAIASVFLLSSCITYQLVSPGKVDIDGKLTAETDVAWNWRSADGTIHWTQDGPGLQQLVFHVVEDGKALYSSIDDQAKQTLLAELTGKEKDVVSLKFRKVMTEPELMDLVAGTLPKIGLDQVKPLNFAPDQFAGHPGFRFEYEGVGKDDVKRRGLAVGAVVEDKLYLVNYFGTSLYHYQKALPAAEKVIRSVQISQKKG